MTPRGATHLQLLLWRWRGWRYERAMYRAAGRARDKARAALEKRGH